MSLTPTIMTLASSTAGIGAPQFHEGGEFLLKLVNVAILVLAVLVLWRNAFGKKSTETTVSPSPLMVKAHEEYITRREFAEIKARTISVEAQIREIKETMHQTELRLIDAGNDREHKIMERIDKLVPEIAKALDRTDYRKGPGGARA